jgi:hypothetical protein
MACTVPKVKGHGVLRASPVSGQRLNDHEISKRNYNPIRWMISGWLILIYCERKTLLNGWLISADKHKRTG